MDSNLRPIAGARAQVDRQLREAILSRTFKHGEKLPREAELASRFAVSRTTVREALRSLASAGLIIKVPGASGGNFVNHLGYHSLGDLLGESIQDALRLRAINYDEINRVRRLLEISSVRLATVHRTESDVEALRNIVDRHNCTIEESLRAPQLEVLFHSAVADTSKNRFLASFVSALYRVICPIVATELSSETWKETACQHVAIVEAIDNGDAEAAAIVMEEHLTCSQKPWDERTEAGDPQRQTR